MTFMQAQWFTPGPRRNPVRKVVWHDMEAAELFDTAERCARYFRDHPGVDSRGKPSFPSAHECIDADSWVGCVHDTDIAHHAPGANHDGIGLELAGFARQTREEWLDPYGLAMLRICAKRTALRCVTFGLPAHFLTAEEMRADPGAMGLTTHWQVSLAYRKSTHSDPGVGFPVDVLLEMVRDELNPAVVLPIPVPQEDDVKIIQCGDAIAIVGAEGKRHLSYPEWDGVWKRRVDEQVSQEVWDAVPEAV